ncbi:MAG: LysR family transcriptional regulator [Clostridia bacterium]|nr:LysR family transcriptional regulator [Clostridia bacterium]
MNILHLKYVVSIAENGSINKAAEELHVAQPNLSRVIKDMESNLGIVFFRRTSKGMLLTPDGERFIGQARKILEQVDEMEKMYTSGLPTKQTFSLSAPRASYISDAFSSFSRSLSDDNAELYYHEANALQAIKNIQEVGYNLGIIRYAANYDKYFKIMLEEKNLEYDLIAEFKYVLVMHEASLLAKKDTIHFDDLRPFIQIAHADPYVPSLPLSVVRNEELPDVPRRIFVFERGSQLDLLAENIQTFMWVSPLPDRLLHRLHLVQRECPDNHRIYKDMLIYKKDYRLTELDKRFVTELCQSKRKCFEGITSLK